jgi:hypothetical protein
MLLLLLLPPPLREKRVGARPRSSRPLLKPTDAITFHRCHSAKIKLMCVCVDDDFRTNWSPRRQRQQQHHTAEAFFLVRKPRVFPAAF